MNEVEERLRDLLNAAVGEPPELSTAPVRRLVRRHRRRNALTVAGSVLCAAALVAAGSLVSGLIGPSTPNGPGSGARFPGGGRLLVDAGNTLKWLYPNGRTTVIARGFGAAVLADGGTKLLAWRETQTPTQCQCSGALGNVYLMNLNGSDRRLVLGVPSRVRGEFIMYPSFPFRLSPDGSEVAYFRDVFSSRGRLLSSTLWVINLATGRRTDLGAVGYDMTWSGNQTILFNPSDQRSIDAFNLVTGRRWIFITITDPRLVSAFRAAQPVAGQPAYFGSLESSTVAGYSTLAVQVNARIAGPNAANLHSAVALIRDGSVLCIVPRHHNPYLFQWGPHGLFTVTTTRIPFAVDTTDGLYVGQGFTSSVTHVSDFGPFIIFNPAGNVMLVGAPLDSPEDLRFEAVPAPQCRQSGACMHFSPVRYRAPKNTFILNWAA